MFKRVVLGLSVLAVTGINAGSVGAQSADMSPTILIESGPSDMPGYRRMVFVKYLSGDRVTANYVAYNRSEFRQVPDTTSAQVVQECARGAATPLEAIQAFEQTEKRLAQRGERPIVARFCIKGVRGWETGNKDRYTDPIFNGMPYAATRR